MTRPLFTGSMMLLSTGMLMAQSPPTIAWQDCLGGTSNDIGNAVQQTNDGGYIVAGQVNGGDADIPVYHGAGDAWIAKLDANGLLQWQRGFGGSGLDFFSAVRQTNDGGYVAVGQTASNSDDVSGNHGAEDAWIVKFDANGDTLWEHCLGGSSCCEQAWDVWQATDGGYWVAAEAASTDGDLTGFSAGGWMIRLDVSGNIQWQQTLSSSHPEVVQQTADGGVVFMGNTTDGSVPGHVNQQDFWVIKYSAAMDLEWQRAAGGQGQEWGYQGKQTADGSYVLSGGTISGDINGSHGWSFEDILILKLDATGTVQWMRAFGGSDDDFAHGLSETNDGGIVASAESWSQDGDVPAHDVFTALWLVKLDPSSGDIQWSGTYGGTDSDAPRAICGTSDGGLAVSGSTHSNDGDVSGNHGGWDTWVVKFGEDALGVKETDANAFSLSPVPATTTLHINATTAMRNVPVTLNDAMGRTVLVTRMSGTSLTLDVSDLPRGLYLVTFQGPSALHTERVMLQ